MTPSILLDQHISPETADRLVALGFDVVPVRDRGLLGWQDWDLMAWCIRNRRAICTRNGPDFEREHRHCRDRGEEHHGVLVVGNEWDQEAIYWALRQYLESEPEPVMLMNQVFELPPATTQFMQERMASEQP